MPKFLYNGVEVVVEFAGFFDCVDRTHPEMGPLDRMHPLTPVLDDGGVLHPAAVKALIVRQNSEPNIRKAVDLYTF